MGDDPNSALGIFAAVKGDDQSFDDWDVHIVQIMKIAAGVGEKLRRVEIESDSTGAEVSRCRAAHMLLKFSSEVSPSKNLRSVRADFEEAQARCASAAEV